VVNGQPVSDNLVTFGPPKTIPLLDPELRASIAQERNVYQVKITARRPALWTWIELDRFDAKFSDNFVHVRADSPAAITVQPARELAPEDFVKALRVRSLYNTYT